MIKKIIILFLIWRSLLFIVAAVAPQLVPVFGNKFPYVEVLKESKLPYWIWSFGNFDGVHYIRIAKDGYAYQYTQAFFPLYPILIKLFSFLTLGNFVMSALIISNGSFLIALIILGKLVTALFNQDTALWTIIFILCFPTSFYFGSIYTESIFLLFIFCYFYFYNKKKYLVSSIFGVFASSTRLVGVLLGISTLNFKQKKSLIPFIIVPLGLACYMFFLYIKFHNPLYFLTSQSAFGQERSTNSIVLLPQVFYRYIKIIATTNGQPLYNALFELTSTIFVLSVLTVGYLKKIKKEWLAFSLLSVITPTLTGSFASMPRYIIVAFPIFIIFAQIKSGFVKATIAVLFLLGLVVATTLFTRGYWIA